MKPTEPTKPLGRGAFPLRSPAQAAIDHDFYQSDPAKRMRATGVPERYHALTWDDYTDTTKVGRVSLKSMLRAWSDAWPDVETGLVLLGPPGWGKTMGMALLALELKIERRAFVRYTTYADLVLRKQKLIRTEREADASGDYAAYNTEFVRIGIIELWCDVLFLDDVGKEYRAASGWSDDGLDHLLRSRYEAGKITVVSSNLKLKQFEGYNSSMASFLHDVGDVLELTTGADRRVRRSGLRRQLEDDAQG